MRTSGGGVSWPCCWPADATRILFDGIVGDVLRERESGIWSRQSGARCCCSCSRTVAAAARPGRAASIPSSLCTAADRAPRAGPEHRSEASLLSGRIRRQWEATQSGSTTVVPGLVSGSWRQEAKVIDVAVHRSSSLLCHPMDAFLFGRPSSRTLRNDILAWCRWRRGSLSCARWREQAEVLIPP